MKGFHFPPTRTTNLIRLILGSQYSLYENYIKRARLLWGLKQVLGTNLIPLRTKFDTQTKRVPAWPVINQLWFPERHFSANGISLCLGEVQINETLWEIIASSPFLGPSRLCCSLARSGETCLTHPNRRACSQARFMLDKPSSALVDFWRWLLCFPGVNKLFPLPKAHSL